MSAPRPGGISGRLWRRSSECHQLCRVIQDVGRRFPQDLAQILAEHVALFLEPSSVVMVASLDKGRLRRLFSVEAATGEVLHELDLGDDLRQPMAFAPSGEYLVHEPADSNGCLTVSDAVTGVTLHTLHLGTELRFTKLWYRADVTSIVYAPSGQHIAVGNSEGDVFFFDLVSQGVVVGDTSPSLLSIASLAYSPNGARLAAAGHDVNESPKVIILESVTGTVLREVLAPMPVAALEYAPDGQHLAARCESGTLLIIDASTGLTSYTVDIGLDSQWDDTDVWSSMAFAPDGEHLAASSVFPKGSYDFWGIFIVCVASGLVEHTIDLCHNVHGLSSVTYSASGEHLVASISEEGDDNVIYIFQAASGTIVHRLELASSEFDQLIFDQRIFCVSAARKPSDGGRASFVPRLARASDRTSQAPRDATDEGADARTETAVIQHVAHPAPPDAEEEAAAVIEPEEAAATSAELWASGVERLSPFTAGPLPGLGPSSGQRAVLLTFSRCPRELEEAILGSPPAQEARARGVDVRPAWACGAKVLLEGLDPADLAAPLGGEPLRLQHVVLREADEPALMAALQRLPVRIRKLKPGAGRVPLPEDLSVFAVSSGEEDDLGDESAGSLAEAISYRVERTFIHVPIPGAAEDTRTIRTW